MRAPDQTTVEETLPEASRRLIRTADTLAEEEYAEPSGLPGWTRAHVLAHLALNAEGLAGALTGIVEGDPLPMYRSQEARDGDIDELAGQPPASIRARLLGATTDLADAVAAVPEDRWDAVVERTPGSERTFPAGAVPWMRLREVEIHHADLAAGYVHTAWPLPFAVALVESLTDHSDAAGPFRMHATDADRTWQRGTGGPTVSGTAADLGWWLTGRGDGAGLSCDGTLPRIGAW